MTNTAGKATVARDRIAVPDKDAVRSIGPPVTLDDLDHALVDCLQRDGRESSRSLANRLNINEVTVSTRLRRMEHANVMRVVAVTDIRLFGHREFAFAFVSVSGRPVTDVAAEIAALRETVSVTICTGRCDIIAPLLGRDRRHLGELFDLVLRTIDGVDDIQGILVLDVIKYDSQWSLLAADPGATPEARPSDAVDAIDLQIIRLLQSNARRSNRSIAAMVGVSEGTVRGRIKRMLSERVFRIQAILDVVAFGLGAHAFLAIRTFAGEAVQVANALSRRSDVAQLTRILGDTDILAVLVAPDRESLVNAILGDIALTPGVRSTETFDTCATLKHMYAWTWVV